MSGYDDKSVWGPITEAATALASSRHQALLTHPGTQYAYHLATQLHSRGRLARFHTSFAIRDGSLVGRLCDLLPSKVCRRLEGRRLGGLPADKLSLHPFCGVGGQFRRSLAGFGEEEILHRRNKAFQRSIPDKDISSAGVVVGFDTSSWLLASRVKKMGGKFILDQSIGHPVEKERIYKDVRDRFPEWSASIPRKADGHVAEEIEEHNLADLVVVPSSFVRETLTMQGVPCGKIRVIPFGTNLDLFQPAEFPERSGPVVFLFVGSISARKGVPILLQAWRRMSPVKAELWIVGPGSVPNCEAIDLPASVLFFGPKNRSDVAELMRQADVFVFPSFFEGLAQVQIEALASGLPIISTVESGAGDIVRDGQNGFLVPAGDANSLKYRMLQIATDRSLLNAMRKNVIEERANLSWSAYGDRWVKVIDELV